MKPFIFRIWIINSKWNLLFFNFEYINSKVEKWKFNLRVTNSKGNLMFYKVQLITRRKNFCKNFRASNSKCDVILRNSISQLDFVTREFRTSVFLVIYPRWNNWKLFHPCDVNYCNVINVNHVFLLGFASISNKLSISC